MGRKGKGEGGWGRPVNGGVWDQDRGKKGGMGPELEKKAQPSEEWGILGNGLRDEKRVFNLKRGKEDVPEIQKEGGTGGILEEGGNVTTGIGDSTELKGYKNTTQKQNQKTTEGETKKQKNRKVQTTHVCRSKQSHRKKRNLRESTKKDIEMGLRGEKKKKNRFFEKNNRGERK